MTTTPAGRDSDIRDLRLSTELLVLEVVSITDLATLNFVVPVARAGGPCVLLFIL